MSQASEARRVRIGLLWHSPSAGNLGVGALTVANLAIVRQVAQEMGLEPVFTIVGMREVGKRYIDETTATSCEVSVASLLTPSGCWRWLGEQDCVLDIGAGDSFADIYGFKRFLFLWLTKMLTVARGVPLLLSPQTIGPFTRQPYRALAAVALRLAQAVVVRDAASLQCLRELAPKARGMLATDVAFALPFEDRRSMRNGARLRVGVNVSGLLFQDAVSGRNRFGLEVDYAALMRGFVADLAMRSDVEVHLLAHAKGERGGADDDAWVADQFAKEFPSAVRAPDFTDPSAAKSYISSLDFLVAGRMHACIAAYSARVAVVPVAYSRKFSGLFGLLGYRWLIPVSGMPTAAALSYLHEALDKRAELVANAEGGVTKVDAMLDVYKDCLRALLSNSTMIS
jgi:polysaccharide pyruvyl transferase WcaK-like protein